MLNSIVRWTIVQRWFVVLMAGLLTLWSVYAIRQMPLDVLPNFAPPQVEVQTEAPGLAPEAVESMITIPLESAVNGIPDVDAVRTASALGVSVLRINFKWGTDVQQARQFVAERLQQVQTRLPVGSHAPEIAPITPPIGTVIQYALTSEQSSLMAIRTVVDQVIAKRLMAVPGVAQVLVYGGDIQQFQVMVDPQRLQAQGVSLEQVVAATQAANGKAVGGLLINADQEMVISGVGQVQSIAELAKSVVKTQVGTNVLLQDVAEVKLGAAPQRGDASWNAQRAVIIMVNKQPLTDTPTVTQAVMQAMTELKTGLPADITVRETFRQGDYIAASVDNVKSALLEGSVIVALILIPFLMNWRTLTVCLLDFGLTLLFALWVCDWLDLGLNTMTLGGLAVAIGTAVDDAIVYAENTFRRLRENRFAAQPLPTMEIIFEGTQEVRSSLLSATLIGIIIFAPVFTLSGVEGRIFTPMGIAYLVVVVISSLESLLVSPALCALLLPASRMMPREPWLTRFSKGIYEAVLAFAMQRPNVILGLSGAALVATVMIAPALGREFLPAFQERSLMNAIALFPGSSLEATNRVGMAIQTSLQGNPLIDSVQLRAGRVPGDPDAAAANLAHLDVELSAVAMKNRPAALQAIRDSLRLPGVVSNVGGFISHRMDEVLSGVRSAIAIKIYGPDLNQLRDIGVVIEKAIREVPGMVDLQLEPQLPIRQVKIEFKREVAGQYGLTIAQLSELTETALNGQVVGQVAHQQQLVDVLVWVKAEARRNLDTIRQLPIATPIGKTVTLGELATIDYGTGPNTINRENRSRLIVVSANVAGRDLGAVVNEAQARIRQAVQLPEGYYIQFGGQFASQQQASHNLLIYGIVSVFAIAVLMYLSVKSLPALLMIMLNLPLSLVGGVMAIVLTGGVVSIPSLVGFVTLFGVAARNGLLLVDNYNTKFAQGMPLKETIIQGSMERVIAILMTALTSALGVVPLVLSGVPGGGPGKELLQPLAIVVLGGLFSSAALTLVVLPALYMRFGHRLRPHSR
jgi:CzcA family heavy metal efflux pump